MQFKEKGYKSVPISADEIGEGYRAFGGWQAARAFSSSARFQGGFASIIPIAQLSVTAAKTSPAPDKVGSQRKSG
jgi:hypothetical protein